MNPLTALPLVGSALGYVGQQQTNKANEMMGLEQMNWQKMMSDSAHQREVKDLMAAGLNPILSAGGSGASTPSGAMPVMENSLAHLGKGLSEAGQTAIALKQQSKGFEKIDAEIGNMQSDTQNKNIQNSLFRNQAALTAKEIEAKSYSNKILAETVESQIKKAQAEGDYARVNQLMQIINMGASSASSIVNPLKLLPPQPPVKPKIGF